MKMREQNPPLKGCKPLELLTDFRFRPFNTGCMGGKVALRQILRTIWTLLDSNLGQLVQVGLGLGIKLFFETSNFNI